MFGKLIVFGLFEIIQKKKVRTAFLGPGQPSGRVRYDDASHHKDLSIYGVSFSVECDENQSTKFP